MKGSWNTLTAALLLSTALPALANDWPQWRGPERNGISRETGLLKQWPKNGPALLWKISDSGSGYAAPSVVGDRIFLLGSEGLEDEFVQALSVTDGKRIWRTRLGLVGQPKQNPNFPTARSTPTVERDCLYALGSGGDLACVDLTSGEVRWRRNLPSDFGGKPGDWAYAESPLVDGNTLVCTPGGKDATLVALDKKTGEVVWKCPLPEADQAAYASAVVVEADGVRQYVQLLEKGLVGVEAKTGQFLWRYARPVSPYRANIPSPLASQAYVYSAAAGAGGGLVMLRTADGKTAAEQVYFEAKYPTAIGGAVKIGDYLYGTTGQSLLCSEFTSGQVKWQERALGPASLCYAGGRLYMHGENGDVALVEPSPESYREVGRFTPPDQPKRLNNLEKAWAYPVVANGRLYLRDHGHLWCYDVRDRQ